MAGGPSEVVDCGAGWAKLQLAARQQLEEPARQQIVDWVVPHSSADKLGVTTREQDRTCLLYTSDAADDPRVV